MEPQQVVSDSSAPTFLAAPLSFDLHALRASLHEVTSRYPFGQSRRQISLTHPDPVRQSIEDGTGSLYDFEREAMRAAEQDFKYFSREFEGTYFRKAYDRIQTWTGGKIGRVRLMCLPPRSCYSMHRDPSPRLHLALTTNPHSFLVFLRGEVVSIPADGRLYFVNTRRDHSAMNGGLENRIHLVFSVA